MGSKEDREKDKRRRERNREKEQAGKQCREEGIQRKTRERKR